MNKSSQVESQEGWQKVERGQARNAERRNRRSRRSGRGARERRQARRAEERSKVEPTAEDAGKVDFPVLETKVLVLSEPSSVSVHETCTEATGTVCESCVGDCEGGIATIFEEGFCRGCEALQERIRVLEDMVAELSARVEELGAKKEAENFEEVAENFEELAEKPENFEEVAEKPEKFEEAVEGPVGTLEEGDDWGACCEKLGFSVELHRRVMETGWTSVMPIQRAVLPALVGDEFRTVVGIARAGEGKTAAYVLPILARLRPGVEGVQAVVVVPTAMLAEQVAEVFRAFGEKGVGVVTPGSAVRETVALVASGRVRVAVGTAGRLYDVLRQVESNKVELLVLDEADELVKDGLEELYTLPQFGRKRQEAEDRLKRFPHGVACTQMLEFVDLLKRQGHLRRIALFSATRGADPTDGGVLSRFLDAVKAPEPRLFYPSSTPTSVTCAPTVSHFVRRVETKEMEEMRHFLGGGDMSASYFFGTIGKTYLVADMVHQIVSHEEGQVLVFCNSNERAKTFGEALQTYTELHGPHTASALSPPSIENVYTWHGLMPPHEQSRTREALLSGRARVVVASDTIARGIDVSGIRFIVNADIPQNGTTYIQRVGRAGRHSRRGIAVSVVNTDSGADRARLHMAADAIQPGASTWDVFEEWKA